ncbi:hypothetical protein LXA43DRAFT_1065422 [Ganoderma leucocontextum]|nr:hypothetical protein LXA43DRAFT_1065416 [Ganoderma leucocontextum]KAI1785996.1 hypothetical protein LXA43DRAFT_1065422 [Ganoderma leucocontextum]
MALKQFDVVIGAVLEFWMDFFTKGKWSGITALLYYDPALMQRPASQRSNTRDRHRPLLAAIIVLHGLALAVCVFVGGAYTSMVAYGVSYGPVSSILLSGVFPLSARGKMSRPIGPTTVQGASPEKAKGRCDIGFTCEKLKLSHFEVLAASHHAYAPGLAETTGGYKDRYTCFPQQPYDSIWTMSLSRVQDSISEIKQLTASRAKSGAEANTTYQGSKETQEKGVQTSIRIQFLEERKEAIPVHEGNDDDMNAIGNRKHDNARMVPKRPWQQAGRRLLLAGMVLAMGVLLRQHWMTTAGGYRIAEATGASAWARYSGDITH